MTTLDAFCAIQWPVSNVSYRYWVGLHEAGPSIATYRRLEDSAACPSDGHGHCRLVPTFALASGLVADPEHAPPSQLTFQSEFDACDMMLTFDCLRRLLQTWPWSPVSVYDYRCREYERAQLRLGVGWPCSPTKTFNSCQLKSILCQPNPPAVAVYFNLTPGDIETLQMAEDLPGLEMPRGCRDREVEQLQCMGHLKYLGLRGTRISSKVAETIGGLRNLKRLDLSLTAVTDRLFEACDAIGRIGDLSIAETQITNAAGRVGKRKNATRVLNCSRTAISNEFFTDNSDSWAEIGCLNVSQTGIGDPAAAFFSECRSLLELNLDFCNVTWGSLKKFCGNTTLGRLSLRGVRISEGEYYLLRDSMPQCLVTM